MATCRMRVVIVGVALVAAGCTVSSHYRLAYPDGLRRSHCPHALRFVTEDGREYRVRAESVDTISVFGTGESRSNPRADWVHFSGSVPIDSIALVAESPAHIWGGTLPLATFAAIVAAGSGAFSGSEGTATADFYHPVPPGGGGGGSCPFVYTHDGTRYVLEAEPCAGAMLESMQRTSYDRLDHPAMTDHVTRLRITCELDETEHIDQVRLLAVDHAPGTVIVPTESGHLCVLRTFDPPVWVMDSHHMDASNLTAEADGREWSSSPGDCDPGRPDEMRAGLTAAFPRPADADTAVLVVDLRNAEWAFYMMQELMTLTGRDLGAWHVSLNSSALLRDALSHTVIREAMLQVAVKDGASWRAVDHLWAVGSAVTKTLAVPIDISGLAGETLTIRLDSGPGFWVIDRIGIGFDPQEPAVVTPLYPEMARDQNGRDLRDALRAEDGDYYDMPTTQDWAEVAFIVPPKRPSYERSFVLQTTGYYEPHIRPTGDPQRSLLAKFMIEPGAFCAYSAQRYREMMATQAER